MLAAVKKIQLVAHCRLSPVVKTWSLQQSVCSNRVGDLPEGLSRAGNFALIDMFPTCLGMDYVDKSYHGIAA